MDEYPDAEDLLRLNGLRRDAEHNEKKDEVSPGHLILSLRASLTSEPVLAKIGA